MDWTLLAGLAFLTKTAVDLAKFVRNKQWGDAFTIMFVMAVGVAVILLASQTDFAETFDVAGIPMSSLNTYSQIVLGLTLAGTGSFAVDLLKSRGAVSTPKLFKENNP